MIPPTQGTDIATTVTIIKDMMEHLAQQDTSNKVTNDRFDIITAADTLPAANNDERETTRKPLFPHQQSYGLGSLPSNKPANRHSSEYNARYHLKDLQSNKFGFRNQMCPCYSPKHPFYEENY